MQPTQWQFYLSSHEAWKGMLEACHAATFSIDIEQYLFELDAVGRKFLEVCIKKAHAGVKVRILCDAVGSNKMYISRVPTILERAGIEIVFYNSFIFGTPGYYTTWFFRDHRKLMIIDKKIGFTGGICFREEMKDWRDTHVQIRGPVVSQMTQAFNDMWKRSKKIKSPHKTKKLLPQHGEFNFVSQSPIPRRRYAYYLLIDAIKKAKKNIYLTSPYFLPHHKLLRALKRASRRGVDVQILVPEKSDHSIVDIAGHTYYNELLRADITIWQYKSTLENREPVVIHAKTAIIDDSWCSVGSLNLDHVSLLYNFEASLISTNKEFVKEVTTQFLNDTSISSKITQQHWDRRSYVRQFIELLILPFRRFL